MLEKREHYIPTAYADENSDGLYINLISKYKAELLSAPILNDNPPPPRELIIVLGPIKYSKIFDSKLDKVFGIVFESQGCLENLSLKPEFINKLKGVIGRIKRENANIKYYGIVIGLYIKDKSDIELSPLVKALRDICDDAGGEVRTDFELIYDEQILKVFLRNLRLKVIYGDTDFQQQGSLG